MTSVYLGLGSNVGDRIVHIRTALACLRKAEVDGRPVFHSLISSSLYENPAWVPADAPADWNRPFLNLAVKAETDLPAAALLNITQAAEEATGRIRRGVWGPREMDIDILIYGDRVLQSENLTLPHPGVTERPFVLIPLIEIAPGLSVNGQTIEHWLSRLDTSTIKRYAGPISPMISRGDRG